jgi:hypothetical protein
VRALTYLPCMFLRAFVFTLPRASLMAASASSSSYLKQNTMRVKGVTDSLEVERGRERGRDTRRHREIVRECGSGTGRGCDVIRKIEWKGNISQGCEEQTNTHTRYGHPHVPLQQALRTSCTRYKGILYVPPLRHVLALRDCRPRGRLGYYPGPTPRQSPTGRLG